MSAATRNVAPPTWWGKFLEEVRRTGRVADSLEKLDLKRTAHTYYTANSRALEEELDQAIEEGKANDKVIRVTRVLSLLRTGMSVRDAVREAGETSTRFYMLVEETGMRVEFEKIRRYWDRKRNGYRESVDFLDRLLADDIEHYDGHPVVQELLNRMREIVELCDVSYKELGTRPRTWLRDEVLQLIAKDYMEEDGLPPFLEVTEV